MSGIGIGRDWKQRPHTCTMATWSVEQDGNDFVYINIHANIDNATVKGTFITLISFLCPFLFLFYSFFVARMVVEIHG